MTEKKIYSYCFYENCSSNDWAGIYLSDIEEISNKVLIDLLEEVTQELKRRFKEVTE